jgi:2'-5' RNA ligase
VNIPPYTYAVLDIPEPAGGKILDIRRHNQDAYYAALPAEVTLVGSSGVGCFQTDQEAADVFAVLDAIAASTAPITTTLSNVIRFPDTDIFAFQFTDETGLRQLHQRIVESGLRFQENRWPYGPHCTLRSRSPVTAEEASAITAERIEEPFVLDQLSVYHLDDDPCGTLPVLCHLLHRARLRASPKNEWIGDPGASSDPLVKRAKGPEGAASYAAVRHLRDSGFISGDERVVVFNTGMGIKY